ncbi:MAG: integrase [Granulosicoccus sp.]|jgi:integrase
MPKIITPLNEKRIKAAKPKDKEYTLSDGGGLNLRIRPNDTKTWFFNFTKPYFSKRLKISLGSYDTVSLKDARIERSRLRDLIQKNIDPIEDKKENDNLVKAANSNTLAHIAEQWFNIKKTTVTPNYAEDIWRSLEKHIFPHIGNTPIYKINAPTTIDILKPIAARGNLETIKRLCQRINEIMDHAVNSGFIHHNPLAGISKAFSAPQKNHMPTLKPAQLPELMSALNTASIKRVTRCLIEWQLHTMTRPSEAAGAKWEEIDRDNKLWHIPEERMKKRRTHTIPLSEQAIALLDVMQSISGHREYVFPADRDPKKHIHEQTANMALTRMGFKGRLVAHGLRSIASTTLNEQGFAPDIIEAALAHLDKNEVRRAYNRAEYIAQRRTMMAWWSNHIEEAATGNMSLSSSVKHLKVV